LDSLQANYALAVKLTRSLLNTLLIVTLYLTAKEDSTVHPLYRTALDILNKLMFLLYIKLGHYVALFRDYSALYLDVFPRRVNQNLALGLGDIVN